MIVKNEASCIERCLESVKSLIDAYCIVDTGSTDATKQIISRVLADKPGRIYDREWVNFGHNRTEVLYLAKNQADYLLILDADMTIRLDSTPVALSADAFNVKFEESVEYWLPILVKSTHSWRYEGVTHEYLTSDEPFITEKLDWMKVQHWGDGGTRSEKFKRDLRLLSDEYKKNPQNARTIFYLAQTYKDMGMPGFAASYYRERVELGGWEEEVYYSKFQLGLLYEKLREPYRCLYQLAEAWNYRPQRLEALYELIWRLRTRGLHYAAYQLLKSRPVVPTSDILFVSQWIWDWGLNFEYSIVAWNAGEKVEAIRVCEDLLKVETLPESYRNQVVKNLEYMQVRT